MTKPDTKPTCPNFSSGPCAKRPGWSVDVLKSALNGRSHRSKPGKAQLQDVIEKTRSVLKIPADYKIGIMPASDTGAYEAAMWTMLGARGVEALAWESFSQGWVTDILKQLKIDDVVTRTAEYGELPDLNATNFNRDVVFCWNGTTSGVKVPNGDWIPDDRAGLTLCDATSAAFAMKLPWDKLDVTTFSWQKVMGGEAQHGILILSPRAVERLESYTPPWPLPKIFRLTKGGKLIEGIFKGETINTPSMLAVADALDALNWMESIGGLPATIERSNNNLAVLTDWVNNNPWIDFLVSDPAIRSNTSICLKLANPNAPADLPKQLASMLDAEGVAYDIGAYRDAPAGLRIWGGATVESDDIAALLPWLEWAYGQVSAKQAA